MPIHKPDDVVAYNRRMWDHQVAAGDRWTIPVSPEVIAAARRGEISILLPPSRPVPADWFPPLGGCEVLPLGGCEVLCLAGGGGQQAPILAAAGARVTVFDNSPRQLAQDQMVAEREGLELETVLGDMADLRCFDSGRFDFIFHPCSNGFVPSVIPVWREAFRVLRPGGNLVSGLCNPVLYIFDDEARERGELHVRHRIPYSDLTSLSDEEFSRYATRNEPASFGHSLDDQIGGQIDAGFAITGFYEDDWGSGSDEILSNYIKTFVATRATKFA